MATGGRVNQLGGDAYAGSGFAYASLQHVTDAQLLGHLLHFDGLALVRKGAVARDNEEPANLREGGDQVLGDAVGQVLLLRVAGHVVERQHGDRRLLRKGEVFDVHHRRTGARTLRDDQVDPDRIGDVLDLSLAQVFVSQGQLVLHLVVDLGGDADAARLGQALQARRHVHAVAVEVVTLDDHVAKIDADTECDTRAAGHLAVALRHAGLDVGGTGQSIDHAGELDQRTVAHELDKPAAMLGDLGLDEFFAVRFQGGQGARLVFAHESGVAGYIGGQDCCEPAFHFPSGSARRIAVRSRRIHRPCDPAQWTGPPGP